MVYFTLENIRKNIVQFFLSFFIIDVAADKSGNPNDRR